MGRDNNSASKREPTGTDVSVTLANFVNTGRERKTDPRVGALETGPADRVSVQMSMWYSRAALSNKMLCATASGTPAKFFSMTRRELGHVESVCGKSDPHMKLS